MIIIRKDNNGVLDEVVADNCSCHLERMGETYWWMAIYDKDGKEIHLDINGDVPVITQLSDGVKLETK